MAEVSNTAAHFVPPMYVQVLQASMHCCMLYAVIPVMSPRLRMFRPSWHSYDLPFQSFMPDGQEMSISSWLAGFGIVGKEDAVGDAEADVDVNDV